MRKSSDLSLCRNSITVTGCACYCWPAGKASIKGTTAFENTTLYSQSTCSHRRFTHTIRPTRNPADPYDTTTELSPINIIMVFHRQPHSTEVGNVALLGVTISSSPWFIGNNAGKTILLTSKRWIANGNAVIFCGINWTFKSRFMSCILIHELRIFNWLTPIM